MAKNYLTPFANARDANVTSEYEWASGEMASTLSKGFQSGVARSDRVNRALAQGTSAGYSIGQLVADYANQDAGIDAKALYDGFKKALERFSRISVVDVVYPVGSIYCSTSSISPSTLFGVGVWERIGAGRCLVDAGDGFVAGSQGGADTCRLTANEMPPHSHSATVDPSGEHAHTRGSMNITGEIGCDDLAGSIARGAFSCEQQWESNTSANGGDGTFYKFKFNASRSWTGETSRGGVHKHSAQIGSTGGGQSFSVRNPYVAVYMWKRVS